MVHINQAIAATNSYQSLLDIVKVSKVDLSPIFGSRIISAQGYEGTISLDKVARQWMKLDKKITHSHQESGAALSINQKLRSHYDVSGQMIRESHNVFVIFSRIMKSCLSFLLEPLGIPVEFMLSSAEQKTVELAGEKIHMHYDAHQRTCEPHVRTWTQFRETHLTKTNCHHYLQSSSV